MPKPDEHIFVVGGTSGLGLAVSQSAGALGCKVTVTGRGKERATTVAGTIGTRAIGLQLDLEDSASIRAALADGEAIDHLVIPAVHRVATSIKSFDVAEAARLVHVKLVAYAQVVNAALPRLRPTSSIVLFGGLAKANPYPGSTMVSTVNAGIVGLTRTLAVELAPIRVNGISPGLVPDTPAWQKAIAQGATAVVDAMRARTPTGRLVMTEDIVHAVFFLMDNRGVNGIDLEVDGGIQLV